jgi:glycerol-3-phosphate acyltransferase PlsY
MDFGIAVLTAIISYLIGCISFSRMVTRLLAPDADLENVQVTEADGQTGQQLRTMGATTASLIVGPKAGCTIGLLDILKGVVPVLLLRLVYPNAYYFLIAAVFVVVGHNWPVFYRFRGGGGISPTYGGFFVVDFIGTIVSAFAGMIFGFFVIRDILIAYTSGLWFMLVWLSIFKGEWPYIIYGVTINLIFMLGIWPDVKEYLKKKRAGEVEMGTSMETFPMGRGMLKIMNFFGVKPRKKGDE